MKYIYISGPITGVKNYKENFAECETWINEHTNCTPLNPAVFNDEYLKSIGIKSPTQKDYMRVSYHLLLKYPFETGICFLEDYNKSVGAMEESFIAYNLDYSRMIFDRMVPVVIDIPKENLK